VARDATSAGLKIAGIEFDPLEIPTDTELLQELTDEVVAELSQQGLRPIANPSKTYFDEGEKDFQGQEKLKAAENFANSILIEKVKQIEKSPITRNAREYLENLFQNYKFMPQK